MMYLFRLQNIVDGIIDRFGEEVETNIVDKEHFP